MITGLVVLKMVLMPSRQRLASSREFRPAVVDDRRVDRAQHAVGQGVGPGSAGMAPTGRDEFFDISKSLKARCFWR